MNFADRRAQVLLFAAEGCSVSEIADYGRVTRSYVRHVLAQPAPRASTAARRGRRTPHPDATLNRLVATVRA